MKGVLYLLLSILLLSLVACDSNEPTGPSGPSGLPECTDPEAGTVIKIVHPVGGEQFKNGDVINIRFSINAEHVTGGLAKISLNSGKSYTVISGDKSIPKKLTEGIECMTFPWTIPADFVTETNSKIKIWVSDYTDQSQKSVSETFTINP